MSIYMFYLGRQVDDALQFLEQHESEAKLDMKKLPLAPKDKAAIMQVLHSYGLYSYGIYIVMAVGSGGQGRHHPGPQTPSWVYF